LHKNSRRKVIRTAKHVSLIIVYKQSRRRQKQFGGEQDLHEYFFTCPNMTNLVGKFHDINCLN